MSQTSTGPPAHLILRAQRERVDGQLVIQGDASNGTCFAVLYLRRGRLLQTTGVPGLLDHLPTGPEPARGELARAVERAMGLGLDPVKAIDVVLEGLGVFLAQASLSRSFMGRLEPVGRPNQQLPVESTMLQVLDRGLRDVLDPAELEAELAPFGRGRLRPCATDSSHLLTKVAAEGVRALQDKPSLDQLVEAMAYQRSHVEAWQGVALLRAVGLLTVPGARAPDRRVFLSRLLVPQPADPLDLADADVTLPPSEEIRVEDMPAPARLGPGMVFEAPPDSDSDSAQITRPMPWVLDSLSSDSESADPWSDAPQQDELQTMEIVDSEDSEDSEDSDTEPTQEEQRATLFERLEQLPDMSAFSVHSDESSFVMDAPLSIDADSDGLDMLVVQEGAPNTDRLIQVLDDEASVEPEAADLASLREMNPLEALGVRRELLLSGIVRRAEVTQAWMGAMHQWSAEVHAGSSPRDQARASEVREFLERTHVALQHPKRMAMALMRFQLENEPAPVDDKRKERARVRFEEAQRHAMQAKWSAARMAGAEAVAMDPAPSRYRLLDLFCRVVQGELAATDGVIHARAWSGDDPRSRCDAAYTAGRILELAGRKVDAAACYRSAVRLRPGHPAATRQLSKLPAGNPTPLGRLFDT